MPPLATLSSSEEPWQEACGRQMGKCPQQPQPEKVASWLQACRQELCGQFLWPQEGILNVSSHLFLLHLTAVGGQGKCWGVQVSGNYASGGSGLQQGQCQRPWSMLLSPRLTVLPRDAPWAFAKGTTFLSQATCDALSSVQGRDGWVVPGASH